MSEERIKRKNLYVVLPKVKLKDWLSCAEKLGLIVTVPKNGSSHWHIRYPGFPVEDVDGLVTTVFSDMSNQAHQKTFKKIIDKGFKEDDIWMALGMLKAPKA